MINDDEDDDDDDGDNGEWSIGGLCCSLFAVACVCCFVLVGVGVVGCLGL